MNYGYDPCPRCGGGLGLSFPTLRLPRLDTFCEPTTCRDCGTPLFTPCTMCNGTGRSLYSGWSGFDSRCPACGRRREPPPQDCLTCRGTGKVRVLSHYCPRRLGC